MNNLEKEINITIETFDMLEKKPLTFKRVIQQNEILESVLDKVRHDSNIPDSLLDRLTNATFQALTNTIKVWPFSDTNSVEIFVSGVMNWEPESREVLKDHLSELKYKEPELYHPAWDRIVTF